MSDVRPREGGRYSLYCYSCETWVPNTANHEMRGEGCYAHSHSCVQPRKQRAQCPDCGEPMFSAWCNGWKVWRCLCNGKEREND